MTKIIETQNISKRYVMGEEVIDALKNINISVNKGEYVAFMGPSGSGKSTLGRLMLRLIEPTAGEINFDDVNLLKLKNTELRKIRSKMQMIFQDPMSSLNPRMSIRQLVSEPLEIHRNLKASEQNAAVEEIITKVGLEKSALDKYPHEFSGGQRQRISIARAVINNPSLIVADEPVSALDVSIQSQILNLLMDLRNDLNLSFVFISHDLSVVRHIADEVAVMYLGNIVEIAPADQLFSNPQHPYTQALISAIPQVEKEKRVNRIILKGDIPNPADAPSGCYFHPRCPIAIDKCSSVAPALKITGANHLTSCHLVTDSVSR